MVRFLLIVNSALLLTYPLAIYYGLRYFEPRWIGLLGLLLVSSRFIIARKQLQWIALRSLLPPTIVSGIVWLLLWLLDESALIFFNPVLVNLAMFLTFLFSLFYPPTVIERIARLMESDFPDEAIGYTRKVTVVWCIFFLLNGVIAAYTGLFASMKVWAIYNGFVAYLGVGLLFAIEYGVRLQRRRKSLVHGCG